MGRNPFIGTATKVAQEQGITDRQVAYLTDLLMAKAEIKGMDLDDAAALTAPFVAGLSKRYASEMIDTAKADNVKLRALFKPLRDDAKLLNATVFDTLLDDGLYVRGDGTVFKLYHTVHGSNQLVAKELIVTDGKGHFEYRGKAPLASLERDSRRLTLEEARAFGALYGQCCRCLAPLTHEISIALGIGPVCGGHEYGDEFTPIYKAMELSLKQAS